MMQSRETARMLPPLQFAYSQFFVYDANVVSRGCEWTERHSKQGFARRDGVVAIGTLLEFGEADVGVTFDIPANVGTYERAIAVPLRIRGAAIVVDGPEEVGRVRRIAVPNGHYRVTIAQKVMSETREQVGIWLQKVDLPVVRSELLVVDEELEPQEPLLETANRPS